MVVQCKAEARYSKSCKNDYLHIQWFIRKQWDPFAGRNIQILLVNKSSNQLIVFKVKYWTSILQYMAASHSFDRSFRIVYMFLKVKSFSWARVLRSYMTRPKITRTLCSAMDSFLNSQPFHQHQFHFVTREISAEIISK